MIEYLRIRTGSFAEGEKVYEVNVREGIVSFRIQGLFLASSKELGPQISLEFLKQVDALHIDSWNSSYETDKDASDGSYWEMEYKIQDEVAKRSYGWDAYPREWDALMQLINFFGHEFMIVSENVKLHDAIEFATKAHEGQKKPGSDVDFISHPMEVLHILEHMGADMDVQIAGVLHDTLEYTDVTVEDIQIAFGQKVAELVSNLSEDKTLMWKMRKQQQIDRLAKGISKEEELIILADKVSNLRSVYEDYMKMGDAVWEKYGLSKENLSWYYSDVQDQIEDIKFDEAAQSVFWEMVDLYKELFVDHLLDAQRGRLYQVGTGTQVYMMEKSIPVWKEIIHLGREEQKDTPLAKSILKMVDKAREGSSKIQLISKIESQHIEQLWLAPIWKMVDKIH